MFTLALFIDSIVVCTLGHHGCYVNSDTEILLIFKLIIKKRVVDFETKIMNNSHFHFKNMQRMLKS